MVMSAYPRKRTCAAHKLMSALGHKRTWVWTLDEHGRARKNDPDLGELAYLRIDFD
jgi:hypothetical protein